MHYLNGWSIDKHVGSKQTSKQTNNDKWQEQRTKINRTDLSCISICDNDQMGSFH